jgi:hypothetical protein
MIVQVLSDVLIDFCAVQGEVYKVHQYVYVRGEDTPKGNAARDKDFWIARILQVRAASPQHVRRHLAGSRVKRVQSVKTGRNTRSCVFRIEDYMLLSLFVPKFLEIEVSDLARRLR